MNVPPKISPQSLLVAISLKKSFIKKGAEPISVLRQVDLEIHPGNTIAILGKSGTGKSTLLHILGTLESPTSGSIYYLGQDIFQFPEKRIASFRNKELGFIFQFHYLMVEFTALENVMMPALIGGLSRKEAMVRAKELLVKVGLEKRLLHRPSELSGGEQQRVAIARALVMNPKLLLTDEMTGNLDPVIGARIFELVLKLQQEFKMALVSVTHDEQMASVYQRTYRLIQGELQLVRGDFFSAPF